MFCVYYLINFISISCGTIFDIEQDEGEFENDNDY